MMRFFKRRNNNGTAAIEFAILLPFLLIMFFGAFEVSRYILVVRKVENVANDVNFIMSREGTIHDINGDGVVQTGEDVERIESLITSLVPILMAPYDTDNYEMDIRAVARPVDATLAPNDARLMWAHKYSGNQAAQNKAEVTPASFSISTVNGTNPVSTYVDDNFGDRAEMTFEGQTFLMINFAYGYDQVINNFVNYVKLNLESSAIEKISTYAVRSRWIDDGDDILQANEFYNEMQICTDCNEVKSTDANPCENLPARADYPDTNGCKFN